MQRTKLVSLASSLAERGVCARRRASSLGVAGAIAIATLGVDAAPVGAYGHGNWQIAFSSTGTNPATGSGSGIGGWCEWSGGVSSGTDGDCEFAIYAHGPSGTGVTCHESFDITSWSTGPGRLFPVDFFITGTATVQPAGAAAPCLALFPGSPSFTNLDSDFPAAPGHYDLDHLLGGVGNAQVTVTQVR